MRPKLRIISLEHKYKAANAEDVPGLDIAGIVMGEAGTRTAVEGLPSEVSFEFRVYTQTSHGPGGLQKTYL